MPFEVLIHTPMRVPTSIYEHGPFSYVEVFKCSRVDRSLHFALCSYHYAVQVSQRTQLQLRQILSIFIPVKRTVEISSSIRDHLDLADLKFCSGCVVRS